MPLFGRSKRDERSNQSCSHLPLASAAPFPPPRPHQSSRPQHAHQHAYSDPGPYLQRNYASTNTAIVPHYPLAVQPPPAWTSRANLPMPPQYPTPTAQTYRDQQNLFNHIGDKFSDVVSMIDEDSYPFRDRDFIITLDPPQSALAQTPFISPQSTGQSQDRGKTLIPYRQRPRPPDRSQSQSINVLSKVSLYSNSRLPQQLPPLRLYMASWPLVCLAAEYSLNAYKNLRDSSHVNANIKLGTKAMVIKSVPLDDAGLIIFAIRGTSLLSPRDWNINMSTTPISPAGFLDDPGNLTHEGFLRVARAMLIPIAARLRFLLEENPSRSSCSLLITGHSAGGAVAALLYTHMLTQNCPSELSILTGCFKRIHCITFGAPPATLLPLWKPSHSERRLAKSLFLSFINEGDVVCRAEKAYVRSLIDLLASPSPDALRRAMTATAAGAASTSRFDLLLPSKSKPATAARKGSSALWRLPPATLSNAGRLVLLRSLHTDRLTSSSNNNNSNKKADQVSASIVTDQELRSVIFGDPFAHSMALYERRVQWLAKQAVLGR